MFFFEGIYHYWTYSSVSWGRLSQPKGEGRHRVEMACWKLVGKHSAISAHIRQVAGIQPHIRSCMYLTYIYIYIYIYIHTHVYTCTNADNASVATPLVDPTRYGIWRRLVRQHSSLSLVWAEHPFRGRCFNCRLDSTSSRGMACFGARNVRNCGANALEFGA